MVINFTCARLGTADSSAPRDGSHAYWCIAGVWTKDIRSAANRLKSRLNQNTMAKSSAPSTTPAAVAALPALPATYEAALQELDGLVDGLESGQLPLDKLLSGYQRGAQLLAFCKGKLETVETQIKVLEGTELKPWA